MPLKDFTVASLFLGASASASVAFLNASGIYKVEDLMEVGASKRTGLGIRPGQGMNECLSLGLRPFFLPGFSFFFPFQCLVLP
ncbi:hypothetical protein SCA6_015379 [Theobroma cacao]